MKIFTSQSNLCRSWSLFLLAIPLILSSIIQDGSSFVISLFSGQMSLDDLASNSLGYAPFFFAVIFLYGFTTLLTLHIIPIFLAREEKEWLIHCFRFAFFIVLVSLILLVGLNVFGIFFFRLAQKGTILEKARLLFSLYTLSLPPLSILLVLQQFLISQNKNRAPLVFNIMKLTFVVICLILLAPLKNVNIIPISLLVANSLTAFCALGYFYWRYTYFWHALKKAIQSLSFHAIGGYVRDGIPLGLTTAVETSFFAIVNLLFSHLGRESLALNQILIVYNNFGLSIVYGYAQILIIRTATAFNSDSISKDLLYADIKRISISTFFIFALFWSLILSYNSWFVGIFFPKNQDNSHLILMSREIFIIGFGVQAINLIRILSGSLLIGQKRILRHLGINLFGYFFIALPLVIVAVFLIGQNLSYCWEAIAIGLAFSALSTIFSLAGAQSLDVQSSES